MQFQNAFKNLAVFLSQRLAISEFVQYIFKIFEKNNEIYRMKNQARAKIRIPQSHMR